MQYRTILLSLNDEPHVPNLIQAAVSLADGNAHIIGLYAMPSVLPSPDIMGASDMYWLDEQIQCFENQAARIRIKFEDLIERQPLSYEWRFDRSNLESSVADSVIEHGRAADLIVVSRASKNGWIDDVAERAAVESGRPVIVIPEGSNMPAIDTEVLVAWKNSKEATRAVFDALPLLKKARRVRLLTVIEDGTNDGERTSSAELAASLLRHGIKVDVESIQKGAVSVGDGLLDYAESHAQGLLVMGLYGNSRFREFFLGGASRDVLSHASIPTFLSH